MQKNRLKRMPRAVHQPIRNILKAITREVEQLDQQLDHLIAEVPEWQGKVDQLTNLLSAKEAAGSRHAWWLIVTGLAGGKEQY